MALERRSSTMVVIEFSAAWPRWLKLTEGHMSVVAQQYEGRPASLVTQVASRTSRLEASGWRVDSVVFVSNGRGDADSTAARSVLARGLAARIAQGGGGNLLLAIDERSPRRAGAELRSLAAALEQMTKGRVDLAVRVGDRVWSSPKPKGENVAAELAGLAVG